jgi:hypothetical protein
VGGAAHCDSEWMDGGWGGWNGPALKQHEGRRGGGGQVFLICWVRPACWCGVWTMTPRQCLHFLPNGSVKFLHNCGARTISRSIIHYFVEEFGVLNVNYSKLILHIVERLQLEL